ALVAAGGVAARVKTVQPGYVVRILKQFAGIFAALLRNASFAPGTTWRRSAGRAMRCHDKLFRALIDVREIRVRQTFAAVRTDTIDVRSVGRSANHGIFVARSDALGVIGRPCAAERAARVAEVSAARVRVDDRRASRIASRSLVRIG